MKKETKQQKRYRRHKKVRAKIFGTAEIPRLSVLRSNKHIYALLINDEKSKTLVSASDLELRLKQEKKKIDTPPPKTNRKRTPKEIKNLKMRTGKVAIAYRVGELIAKKAIEKKIAKVIFDRGGYKYHGRVQAVAEGAREGGLQF